MKGLVQVGHLVAPRHPEALVLWVPRLNLAPVLGLVYLVPEEAFSL